MIRKVKWQGEDYVKRIRARNRPNNVRAAVITLWMDDVRDFYIRMFRTKGRISGQTPTRRQGREWKANLPWTLATKRSRNPMISDKGYRFGAMVRSLAVRVVAHRNTSFTLSMSNTARSKDGFDYPSHLHAPRRPGHRFTVRPKNAAVLRIPTSPPIFAMETHPQVPVARPHLFFQDRMVRTWAYRMSNWLFDGRISRYPRRGGAGSALRIPG